MLYLANIKRASWAVHGWHMAWCIVHGGGGDVDDVVGVVMWWVMLAGGKNVEL